MRPRVWLAAILVCLLQTGAIAAMIANRAMLLAHGREIVLDVTPIDPRDLFRGDYVRLGYPIASLSSSLVQMPERIATGMPIFVTIERQGQPEEEKWVPVAASPVRPDSLETDNAILLQGVVDWWWPEGSLARGWYGTESALHVKYGIESYFVPEAKGHDLERITRDGAVKAVISVDRKGNAAIKALIVEGRRYGEPLF